MKIYVGITEQRVADRMMRILSGYDIAKFSDSNWYKLTRNSVTKESALIKVCEMCRIDVENVIAFGDDIVDIGMLRLCGIGVAVGNSADEVKSVADVVVDSNDNDGVAKYLSEILL